MATVRHSPYKPAISTAELQARFDGHIVDEDQKQLADRIRSRIKNIVQDINENVTDSREKATALTELETAAMWINKAIFKPEKNTGSAEGESLTQEKDPISVLYDGTKNQYIERWLGMDFVAWSSRNVSGPYPDEVVLTVMAGDVQMEVPKGSLITRIPSGHIVVMPPSDG